MYDDQHCLETKDISDSGTASITPIQSLGIGIKHITMPVEIYPSPPYFPISFRMMLTAPFRYPSPNIA